MTDFNPHNPERIAAINLLVREFSGEFGMFAQQVVSLLPDVRDRAEYLARLSVSIFALSYAQAHQLKYSEMTRDQIRLVEKRLAQMLRDTADLLEAGKFSSEAAVK